jgi:Protein of unknown function (DUF3305)
LITPGKRIPVGIVVERRKAASAWIDYVWRPVDVLVGELQAKPWTVLSETTEVTAFYAGQKDVELHRTETTNYRDNLATGAPSLWVALRPTGGDPAYQIVSVTADPAEGEAYTETGNDLVEALPMPVEIQEMVAAFVAEHHVERAYVKRKRDRADPEALGRRSPGQGKHE